MSNQVQHDDLFYIFPIHYCIFLKSDYNISKHYLYFPKLSNRKRTAFLWACRPSASAIISIVSPMF